MKLLFILSFIRVMEAFIFPLLIYSLPSIFSNKFIYLFYISYGQRIRERERGREREKEKKRERGLNATQLKLKKRSDINTKGCFFRSKYQAKR